VILTIETGINDLVMIFCFCSRASGCCSLLNCYRLESSWEICYTQISTLVSVCHEGDAQGVCMQLSAALQHVEQDRPAQISRLSAQLQQAHADAEHAAAAAASAHAKECAVLEERAFSNLDQVG